MGAPQDGHAAGVETHGPARAAPDVTEVTVVCGSWGYRRVRQLGLPAGGGGEGQRRG